jgi:hypothetical protein
VPTDPIYRLEQLRRSTTALALPAQRQLELWTAPGPLPEEMALEFETSWPCVANRELVTPEQAAALDNLDNALAALSLPSNRDKWFDNQWVLSKDWTYTRSLAGLACQLFS